MSFDSFTAGCAHVGIRVRDLAVSRAVYEKSGFERVRASCTSWTFPLDIEEPCGR